MNDLEMTKLCAEAMNLDVRVCEQFEYDPLHDDAQAMALVKKFCLDIECHARNPIWTVIFDDNEHYSKVRECPDLNRAIVECVAKLKANHKGKIL